VNDPVADRRFMTEALRLARRGLYSTSPNPRVGCVIVRNGHIVGRGWHERAGEPHAEVLALRDAGAAAQGATVYLTLEPCSHHGRTPPCCEALVAAGVARVVVAMRDPNPLVAGRGSDHLRGHGIAVEEGLLGDLARELNIGFVSRMERRRPWFRLKLASSLDGRTAMASGESKWLTGIAARSDVQRLRARSCAIVSGIESVLADNSALNVRVGEMALEEPLAEPVRQPLRVVLDSNLRLRPPARIFGPGGQLVVVTARTDERAWQPLLDAGAEVVSLPASHGRVDLPALALWLAERQCNEVLVECGATLAGAFWQAGLVDHLTVYMAPTLLGSTGRPLLQLPFEQMRQQQRLVVRDLRAVGSDWRIDAEPVRREQPDPTAVNGAQ
jgi:diaminohydroxyphosphoribosylaminopyrimidine deaminase/5-amino-6-(5-phosphoribosylamino)uracil reductase